MAVIPIGDRNPRRGFPAATIGLILINVLVYMHQISLPPRALNAFIYQVGVVPARLLSGTDPRAFTTLLTAMFVHGGLLHLLSNMLFLWVFGDNVEERLGVMAFVLVYLLTGVVASLTQVAANPTSTIPMVGASGALAGVAGCYLVYFPWARVRVLVPLLITFRVVEVSAGLFLTFWFGVQLLQGIGTLRLGNDGGVAWFAHIGGFLAGLLTGAVTRRTVCALRACDPPDAVVDIWRQER